MSIDRAIGRADGENEYDVGFHRGGDALGFPGGRLNVNPGNGMLIPEMPGIPNLNQDEYKTLENSLAALARNPQNVVCVEFEAVFKPGNMTQRPDSFVVKYSVNGGGVMRMREFDNKPGG